MKILAFESSCDDSSIAYVDFAGKDKWVLSASQIEFHKPWGGVVPELAARKHFEAIPEMVKEFEKRFSLQDVDVIAVTYGPGLAGSLLVGLSFAKSLAFGLGKQITGVNHLYGHLAISFEEIEFPAVALLISGGHTNLYLIRDPYDIEEIGHTLDDAAGEAFDKISKEIGVGYPGGPVIEKMARSGTCSIKFPVGLDRKGNTDFSFSGLKTSVINYYRNNLEVSKNDIACSFQNAVLRAFEKKVKTCFLKYDGVKSFLLGGGVAANQFICSGLKRLSDKSGIRFFSPPVKYCTDNALMIAYGGYYKAKKNMFDNEIDLEIKPDERKLI